MKRCIAIAGLALASLAARATVVYSNDFDNPATMGAGVTATLSGGFDTATIGIYNSFYGNIRRSGDTVSLTLSNLPVHSHLSLTYLLAFLDSWDSRDGRTFSPDNLELRIDGNLVHSYTYNNAQGTIKDIGGGTLLYEYVQFDSNVFSSDTVVDTDGDSDLFFPHTASSITFTWRAVGAGWQGDPDEAFGLDNIMVEVDGVPPGGGPTVPEPASLPLVAAAVLGLGVARRRRI